MELQHWYVERFGASLRMVDVGGGINLEVVTAGDASNPVR